MASLPSIDTTTRSDDPSLAETLAGRRVRSAFQPLVDLETGATVGYEALARGPQGSWLESPARLFEAARVAGQRAELEWACQRAAFEGALEAGLTSEQALFVNFEPSVPMSARPSSLVGLTERAIERFPVYVELTERALADSPAELLASVERLRALGAGIALDDVGADPRSLALMPFLAPEVIKLDLRLVQDKPSAEIAETVHAVGAQAESTGAVVLAEGIETEAHLQTALALGARYGQGWLFGRPGRIEQARRPPSTRSLPSPRGVRSELPSPYETVVGQRPTRRGDKRLLLALSRQIESRALSLGSAAVVLSTFQEAIHFTPASSTRYSELAEHVALAGALGVGLPEQPAPGVRGVAIDAADPLRGEWTVTVVAPHFAAAFVARDLGDSGPDMDRRFDFALTYDRELAIAAARALMSRVASLH